MDAVEKHIIWKCTDWKCNFIANGDMDSPYDEDKCPVHRIPLVKADTLPPEPAPPLSAPVSTVDSGDRVISEENRNILKVKCGELRSALEAWKQLKAEGDSPRAEREELERAAGEAENVAKHLQILGVVDGVFDGWEI